MNQTSAKTVPPALRSTYALLTYLLILPLMFLFNLLWSDHIKSVAFHFKHCIYFSK